MKSAHVRDAAGPFAGLPLLLAATLWVFAMVWQKIEATSLGYRVTAALSQVELLEGRVGELQTKLERLRSPDALAARAYIEGLRPLDLNALRVIDAPAVSQPFFSRFHLLAWSSTSRSHS